MHLFGIWLFLLFLCGGRHATANPTQSQGTDVPILTNTEFTVPVGEEARFTCQFSTNERVTFSWRRRGYSRLPINARVAGGVLIVSNVRKQDAGSYECVVRRSNGQTGTVTGTLWVEDRSNSTDIAVLSDKELTVLEGAQARFTCHVRTNERAAITWRRYGSLPLPRGARVAGAVLIISNVQMQDAGKYECTVTLKNGERGTVIGTLRVQDRPDGTDVPILMNTEFTVPVGEEARFRCHVGRGPTNERVTFSWRRRGYIRLPINARVAGGVLIIPNVQKQDAGSYECVVRLANGQSGTVSVTLRVEDRSTGTDIAVLSDTELTVLEGAQARFTCHARTNERATITWRRYGSLPLPHGARVAGGVLIISNVQMQDAGEYECTVTLTNGERGTVIGTLRVQDRPDGTDVPILMNTEFTVPVGEEARFRCHVGRGPANERVTFSWRRRGYSRLPINARVAGGVLIISNVQKQDAGSYECVVRLANGQSGTLSVTVRVEDRPTDRSISGGGGTSRGPTGTSTRGGGATGGGGGGRYY